jgi:hypothetical protein
MKSIHYIQYLRGYKRSVRVSKASRVFHKLDCSGKYKYKPVL